MPGKTGGDQQWCEVFLWSNWEYWKEPQWGLWRTTHRVCGQYRIRHRKIPSHMDLREVTYLGMKLTFGVMVWSDSKSQGGDLLLSLGKMLRLRPTKRDHLKEGLGRSSATPADIWMGKKQRFSRWAKSWMVNPIAMNGGYFIHFKLWACEDITNFGRSWLSLMLLLIINMDCGSHRQKMINLSNGIVSVFHVLIFSCEIRFGPLPP